MRERLISAAKGAAIAAAGAALVYLEEWLRTGGCHCGAWGPLAAAVAAAAINALRKLAPGGDDGGPPGPPDLGDDEPFVIA